VRSVVFGFPKWWRYARAGMGAMEMVKNGGATASVGTTGICDERPEAADARHSADTGRARTVAGNLREQDLKRIISYINDIRYGSVTVIIQDGHVLQIEKNEKIRL
jgi:hypothetical protein